MMTNVARIRILVILVKLSSLLSLRSKCSRRSVSRSLSSLIGSPPRQSPKRSRAAPGVFKQSGYSFFLHVKPGLARKVAGAALLATGLFSARLQAAGWPWNREPDEVSETCSVEPGTVEAGPAARATVRIEAKDSKGHPLQYRWSSNAGKLMGGDATVSPEVQIDLSGLNPGSYAIAGAADDGK